MKRVTLLIACLLLVLGFGLGCKNDKDKREKQPAPALETLDDYRKQAKKQINEDNAEQVLRELKAEIEADL